MVAASWVNGRCLWTLLQGSTTSPHAQRATPRRQSHWTCKNARSARRVSTISCTQTKVTVRRALLALHATVTQTCSTWVPEGNIWRLSNCSSGYYVFPPSSEAFNAAQQKCMPCVKGEECNSTTCSTCSLCQQGYYKAAVSTDPCVACPANTYREETGAVDISNCVSCLAKSSTAGQGGQSSWSSCVCDINCYRIVADSATDACMDCPPGLICDGSSTAQAVVENSSWVPDGAIFRLQSCPNGFFVYPASIDAYNAALQKCLPCKKGEECTRSKCVTCSPRAADSYKTAVSTDACLKCPADTYRATPGAIELGNCVGCPDGSGTSKNT